MAYNNVGSVYFAQGENAKAILVYEKALALKPDYGQAQYNVSVAYCNRENYELSIGHYGRA
jgi:tetratricopeptide (TPR) repeat protein